MYPVDRAKGAFAETIPQFYLVLHQVAVSLQCERRGRVREIVCACVRFSTAT